MFLAQRIANNIYRSYVSKVKVNVKSLSSIKVKSKDYFEKEDQKVKLKVFDDKTQKEVDASIFQSIEVQNSTDAFQFECSEQSKLSIVLELPVESSPELELDISAEESKISVEGVQTKSIKIDLNAGDVLLRNLKSDLIKAETEKGNIETKKLLLGKYIHFGAENGVWF